MKNKPTSHLLVQLLIIVATGFGYAAIYMASLSRGFAPSLWPVARNITVLLFLSVTFVFIIKRFAYRGNLTIFTSAFLLFAVGLLGQYRLFSDPEYVARIAGRQEQAASYRRAKIRALRAMTIQDGYDEEKLTELFGDPSRRNPRLLSTNQIQSQVTAKDFFSTPSTYSPPLAVLALGFAVFFFRKERILSWLQRRSITVAVAAFVPFIVVAGLARGGKFLGEMTPWEVGKVVFLVSLAGILVDTYSVMGLTKLGLPPFRFLLPLVVVTAFAIMPFFLLSDFGQLLVFVLVYLVLYLIAVRRPLQLVHGLILVVVISAFGYGLGKIPSRLFVRMHLWHSTWQAPSPDAWWWKQVVEQRFGAQGQTKFSNDEMWRDQAMQLAQGLFGVSAGEVVGTGVGLGMPETVPVSESDFIYAAIGEEMGFVGGVIIVVGLLLLGLSGIKITLSATDMFTRLMGAGATCFLVFQALVNIGGVIKLLPMTGITLPFVSHGGWSLITSFALVGMLMAISQEWPVYDGTPRTRKMPAQINRFTD